VEYHRRASSQTDAHDLTYQAARRRLHRAGRRHLPAHTATAELDVAANRIVRCACGWRGNGMGWIEHLDHVLRAAISG
jgi:hypothetical protein